MKYQNVVISLLLTFGFTSFSVGQNDFHYEFEDLSNSTEQEPVATTSELILVSFDKMATVLSASDKETINSKISKMKFEGKIKSVDLIVWSDKTLEGKDKYTRKDKKLAQLRIKEIKNVLKPHNLKRVKEHNMAKSGSWLEKKLTKSKTQIKSRFGLKKKPPFEEEDVEDIKKNKAPSKAVILVKLEVENNGNVIE